MTMSEKIMDKIKKLFAHAESCKEIGNAEEAQAFMGKIQALLYKHKMDMSEVESFDPDNADSSIADEKVDLEETGVKRSGKRIKWQSDLGRHIAKANGCKTLVSSGTNNIWFVGRVQDRAIASYVWTYIVRTISAYADKEYSRLYMYHYDHGTQHEVKGWKASFFAGFVQGVALQYLEMADALRKDVGSEKYALVIVEPMKAVDDFMNKFGNGTSLGGSSITNDNGFTSGVEQGQSVNLTGNAVNSSNKGTKLLK